MHTDVKLTLLNITGGSSIFYRTNFILNHIEEFQFLIIKNFIKTLKLIPMKELCYYLSINL